MDIFRESLLSLSRHLIERRLWREESMEKTRKGIDKKRYIIFFSETIFINVPKVSYVLQAYFCASLFSCSLPCPTAHPPLRTAYSKHNLFSDS